MSNFNTNVNTITIEKFNNEVKAQKWHNSLESTITYFIAGLAAVGLFYVVSGIVI